MADKLSPAIAALNVAQVLAGGRGETTGDASKRARDNVGDEAQPETIVPLEAADGAAAELKRPGPVAGE